MKPNFIIAAFFSVFFFTSCSSDHDDSYTPTNNGDSVPTTYFSLTNSNYWKYLVSSQGNNSNDILTVGSSVVDNSITYNLMSGTADPSGTATGFYCTTLNNNKLRIDGSSLKMTGTINYSFPGLTDPISFQLNDFTIFKQNATSGDVLGTIPGSVTQTINNMPVTFEYSLRSEAGENVASLNSNGVTYADVKKSKIILNLKITTTQTITGVPTPITVVIMDAQDVITSTLHYSNGIGMVYCNTLFNYSLNPSVATLLPSNIPLSQNATQDEYLTAYHVN